VLRYALLQKKTRDKRQDDGNLRQRKAVHKSPFNSATKLSIKRDHKC